MHEKTSEMASINFLRSMLIGRVMQHNATHGNDFLCVTRLLLSAWMMHILLSIDSP